MGPGSDRGGAHRLDTQPGARPVQSYRPRGAGAAQGQPAPAARKPRQPPAARPRRRPRQLPRHPGPGPRRPHRQRRRTLPTGRPRHGTRPHPRHRPQAHATTSPACPPPPGRTGRSPTPSAPTYSMSPASWTSRRVKPSPSSKIPATSHRPSLSGPKPFSPVTGWCSPAT